MSYNTFPTIISRPRLLAFPMQAIALCIMILLLIKTMFDVDGHFDSWWYHLPWAARLSGLIPPEAFMFEPVAAVRYEGFPVLAELLQGFLWRITGRVESANLVNFVSLSAFILLLRYYFSVNWWLSIPALLAVPLIQSHTTSTYVDLVSNLGLAVFVLLTFYTYIRNDAIDGKVIVIMSVSALIAANTKLQLIPLVALTCLFATYPLISWFRKRTDLHQNKVFLLLYVLGAILVFSLIFFVPLKNVFQHGNPVYPLKIEILGTVLNYAETPPPSNLGGGVLSDSTQVVKWFYSVFEIGMGPVLNVNRWSLDSAAPDNSPLGIQGGLFGLYVAFNFIIFLWLVTRKGSQEIKKKAIVLILVSTTAAAVMPASHLLRYYMFWFICLISLNLYLLSINFSFSANQLAGPILLFFFLVVVDASDQNFIHPKFYSVESFLKDKTDPNILNKISENDITCLALKHANEPFIYASIWHAGTNHSIKAGPFFPEYKMEVEKTCGEKTTIFSP